MTVTIAINEITDHLSNVIAALTDTGQKVEITEYGRVVVGPVPPHPSSAVAGPGVGPMTTTPTIEDLSRLDLVTTRCAAPTLKRFLPCRRS